MGVGNLFTALADGEQVDTVGGGNDWLVGILGQGGHPAFALQMQPVFKTEIGTEHDLHVIGGGLVGVGVGPGRQD